MTIVMARFMRSWAPGEFPPSHEGMPQSFGAMEWVFKNFSLLATIQLAVAIFSIYAAACFLRLKPWSRLYFEILCWLALTYCVVFGIYWVFMWQDIVGSIPSSSEPQVGPPPATFGIVGIVMGVFVTLFNAAIPAVFIWLLRSRHVRPAYLHA
jgi:hypothetical protein